MSLLPGIADLPFSAGYILAGLFSCGPQAGPLVNVTFQNNPPVINNMLSSENMVQMKSDSVSPAYGGEFPIVDGITNGSIQIQHDVSFSTTVHPMIQTACVAAEEINIVVIYSADVFIDRRYAPGSCRYELTQEHELRHVKTDVDTINEFLPYIKQLVETSVETWKYNGTSKANAVPATQSKMLKELTDVLEGATDSLQRARGLRQPLVDSYEEYQRVSEACPE